MMSVKFRALRALRARPVHREIPDRTARPVSKALRAPRVRTVLTENKARRVSQVLMVQTVSRLSNWHRKKVIRVILMSGLSH